MKIKPFHEEVIHTYEVEMYNVEDIAENGEMATKKSFSLPEVFNLIDIQNKAIEMGFDTFEILEIQYSTKIYSVKEDDKNE